MLKIGLTGGIGSGKSTVAKVFEALHVPVYHADLAARQLMEKNSFLRKEISMTFGPGAYNGKLLNRSFLASMVFQDAALLDKLNKLVHPIVRDDFKQWERKYIRLPYIIEEAAILFETGHFREFDYIVVVCAEEKLRIKRVMERDNVNQDEVYRRISRQMPQKFKMILGDYFIYNNESDLILPQVLEIHNKFISLHRN